MSIVRESAVQFSTAAGGLDDITLQLDDLWQNKAFSEAMSLTEHLCAVLPLLELFDQDPSGRIAEVRQGRQRAALGLFTPNSHFALPVSGLRAQGGADQLLRLTGRFRYASGCADLSLVTVQVEQDDTLRLALLSHAHDGLRLYGAGRTPGWGWAETSEPTLVEQEALSRPVSWAFDGAIVKVIDAYAWEFSRRAITWSAKTVADLRRALAATSTGVDALSTSQYIAHEISKLEIEISLAAAAASFGASHKRERPGGQSVWSVLLSGTDLLARTVTIVEDMSTELGLPELVSDTDAWPGTTVQGYFGGRRMAGGELARRMGLVPEAARS